MKHFCIFDSVQTVYACVCAYMYEDLPKAKILQILTREKSSFFTLYPTAEKMRHDCPPKMYADALGRIFEDISGDDMGDIQEAACQFYRAADIIRRSS